MAEANAKTMAHGTMFPNNAKQIAIEINECERLAVDIE